MALYADPCVVLGLSDSAATKEAYPSPFSLRYSVTLDGPNSISTSLTVMNPGEEKLEFTGALHTYFACESAPAVEFGGLEGVTYEDSVAGGAKATQEAPMLGVSGELDRIYYSTPSELQVRNVAEGRAIKLLKMGFPDAVTCALASRPPPCHLRPYVLRRGTSRSGVSACRAPCSCLPCTAGISARPRLARSRIWAPVSGKSMSAWRRV